MKFMHVGRVCKKLVGKEAGKEVVVVDIIDENFALIDGINVKRRRCNFKHLEPTDKILDIPKGASHEEVVNALKKAK